MRSLRKKTTGKLRAYRYRDLLGHLATLTRQTINFRGQRIEKITSPTPVQARAFDLLGTPVPSASRSQKPSPRPGEF